MKAKCCVFCRKCRFFSIVMDNTELAATVKAEKKLPSKNETSIGTLERIIREYNTAKETNK